MADLLEGRGLIMRRVIGAGLADRRYFQPADNRLPVAGRHKRSGRFFTFRPTKYMEVSSMPINSSRSALPVLALLLALTASSYANPYGQHRRNRNGVSQDQSVTIPENTVISVKMNGTLSSRTSRVGDRFTASVSIPVYVNGV